MLENNSISTATSITTTGFASFAKLVFILGTTTKTNEKLGISNTFSSTMYTSFTHLQNNLQFHLLKKMLQNKFKSITDCR